MFEELHARMRSMARWENNTIRLMGVIEIVLGISLLVPAVAALYYGEDTMVFLYPVPFLLVLGTLQYFLFRRGKAIKPAGGLLMIFLAWWITFLVSSIPFYLSGFSYVDSLFESVSGFTTTGISLISGPGTPQSILFWSALTQWAGGIAIVLVFLFLIPMMSIGGRAFVNNELVGSDTHNFSLKVRSIVGNFISIYILLSVVEAVLLMLSGVGPFDSVTMMFSTISTGGFMVTGNSMQAYPFATEVIVLVFMFLGGTNFYLHYRFLIKRDTTAYRTSQEFIWTVIWFLLATVVLLAIIVISTDNVSSIDPGNTIWNTFFMVVSMGTTTGYQVVDNPAWPIAAYVILWMVMLFGSMSGSTSGGIKIYRLLILGSFISNGVYRMFHPRSVRNVRMDGYSVNEDAVVSVIIVIVMFVGIIVFSTLFFLISEPGISMTSSLGLSMSAITNVGTVVESAAFPTLTVASKIFMTFLMWVGRLEVLIALLIFSRTFWSDLIMDVRGSRRIEKNKKRY